MDFSRQPAHGIFSHWSSAAHLRCGEEYPIGNSFCVLLIFTRNIGAQSIPFVITLAYHGGIETYELHGRSVRSRFKTH